MNASILHPQIFTKSQRLVNLLQLPSQLPQRNHLRSHRFTLCSSSGGNGSSVSSEDDGTSSLQKSSPPPRITPPDSVEPRYRRRSSKRRKRLEESSKKAPTPASAAKKDWEDMTLTEKALELYLGEKGLLFWINKFAYASIFIVIGAWILFRFVGPALNLYQLDTPPLAPDSLLKGS